MRALTVSEITQAGLAAEEAENTLRMDEDSFRAFYERTARPLWAYLARVSGDSALADDLLQETYYRFLRAARADVGEVALRSYLFRIATNLLRDHWRRTRTGATASLEEASDMPSGSSTASTEERVGWQSALGRALARLRPRERAVLWMAYVEGSTHREIAEITGLKARSIRILLFRARRKLAGLLRRVGPRVQTNRREIAASERVE